MLALGELGADVTGRFFAYGSEVPCEFAQDQHAIRRLYEICQQYN